MESSIQDNPMAVADDDICSDTGTGNVESWPSPSQLQFQQPGAQSIATELARPQTPDEQDMLVSRLIARIAELEEKLYQKELEAPAVPGMHVLDSCTC